MAIPFRSTFHRGARLGACLAACAVLAACATGPMATTGGGMAPQEMAVPAAVSGTELDTMFVTRAMQTDMLEIASSQLALQKTTNPQVRQFAQQMIKDHSVNGQQMQQLATANGINTMPAPLPADEMKFQQLKEAQGAMFDRLYATTIGVAAHTEAVTLFEQQTRQGSDDQLRAFAAQKLPALRHHLEMGQALAASMGR